MNPSLLLCCLVLCLACCVSVHTHMLMDDKQNSNQTTIREYLKNQTDTPPVLIVGKSSFSLSFKSTLFLDIRIRQSKQLETVRKSCQVTLRECRNHLHVCKCFIFYIQFKYFRKNDLFAFFVLVLKKRSVKNTQEE